jgi:hypothetical protein
MSRVIASIVAVLALSAFCPPDLPAPPDTLPCTNPAARLSNSTAFRTPYQAARRMIEAKRYQEALQLTHAARASARGQSEVLSAIHLDEQAYVGLGDLRGRIWVLQAKLYIADQCPGLVSGEQADALRRNIPVFEARLAEQGQNSSIDLTESLPNP